MTKFVDPLEKSNKTNIDFEEKETFGYLNFITTVLQSKPQYTFNLRII